MSASYQADREKVVNSLFAMQENAAFKKFQSIRPELKKIFRGQEINNLERILASLRTMALEGYIVQKELIVKEAKEAALDNDLMHRFLYLIPEKIPYKERQKVRITA